MTEQNIFSRKEITLTLDTWEFTPEKLRNTFGNGETYIGISYATEEAFSSKGFKIHLREVYREIEPGEYDYVHVIDLVIQHENYSDVEELHEGDTVAFIDWKNILIKRKGAENWG